MDYTKHFNIKETPQTQPIPGKAMNKNNAGGYSFEVTKWDSLMRFLILGSEGGTYYVSEQKLSTENSKNVVACIKEDGQRVVRTILDVSLQGRASKQDSTLFALALCCTFGDDKTKSSAYSIIHRVCRTGTMLFNFVNNIQSLRGWSRGLRNGVSKFYTDKDLHKIELQLLKYRQRNGYTHKDIMRLAHPKTTDIQRNELFKYAVEKESNTENMSLINAYETAKHFTPNSTEDRKKLVKMITDTGLPREGVPTDFLNTPEIWEALLERMPINAMIRNLGKMSQVGITKSNLDKATVKIITTLRNPDFIKKARIHPMNVLMAIKTYEQGRGFKGSLTWKPIPKIIDALNDAFYLSFNNVEPTGKNYMLALDVSGSMTSPIANSPLSCREASAAMAMVTARTEENHDFIGFTSGEGIGSYRDRSSRLKKQWNYTPKNSSRSPWGSRYGCSQLNISPRHDLKNVIKEISGLPFGGTDCSLPMIYAAEHKIPVDAFVVYTDNETYAGCMHPKQAMDMYRQKMGRDAKLVVVGMIANGFSIADPSDNGMLDVVGFDTATPSIISSFIGGWDID